MVDIDKQIAYWQNGAREELETAAVLFQHNKVNQGFFWAHLALEKALKALIVRETHTFPPFIHDLVRLADKAHLEISDEQRDFLAACNRFSIHGRYQVPQTPIVAPGQVMATWKQIQEMAEWLLKL